MKNLKLVVILLALLCICSSCSSKSNEVAKERELLDNILISVPIWRDKWVDEKHFNLLLDAEVDMVVAVTGVENETFDTSRHMLEMAKKTKREDREIKVLVHCNSMTKEILNYTDEEIRDFLKEFKNNEAVGGYHIVDEPFDPIPFTRVERIIKGIEPNKIADINFLPGMVYGSYDEFFGRMDDYLKIVGDYSSYLSFDNYPFANGHGTVDENQLFGNFEAVRKAGLINDVPTAFYLQAVGGFDNSYRKPDEGTLRYHTSASLAYGFKWIKYWSWFVPDYGNPKETYKDYSDAIIGKDGQPTEMYYIVSQMHKEIHTTGSTLAKLDAIEVYHTGSKSKSSAYEKVPENYFIKPNNDEYAIVSLFKHRAKNEYYLMIVNKDMVNEQQLSFNLQNINSLYELSKSDESKTSNVKLQNSNLNVTLKAGDFVIYKINGSFKREQKISNETNLLPYAKITVNDSASGDNWYVSKAFDGINYSTAGSLGYKVKTAGEKWIKFQFSESVSFNRLSIYPAGLNESCGSAFPDNLKLYTSDDGVNWRLILEEQNLEKPTYKVPSYSFKKESTKYIMLVINSKEVGFEVSEIRLYYDKGKYSEETTLYKDPVVIESKNIAHGKTPFASGSAYESIVDGWGLNYVNDDSKMQTGKEGKTNGWMSNAVKNVNESVFVGINLGAIYTIKQVIVYPRSNGEYFPIDYDIQVSSDSDNWIPVAEIRNDKGLLEGRIINFEPVEARYIRIFSRKLRRNYVSAFNGYIMQISEIEVYG